MRKSDYQKEVLKRLDNIEKILGIEVVGVTTLSGDVNDELPVDDDEENGTAL